MAMAATLIGRLMNQHNAKTVTTSAVAACSMDDEVTDARCYPAMSPVFER